jgi:formylglycine-generating enzyme required for sulfatase activity
MNRAILVPAVILALSYSPFQGCLAQVESRSAPARAAKQTNCTSTAIGSMVLVRGGTVEIGIDAAQIPSFQKIFDIDSPQLFQDEVPKHWVTLDDFSIDECPVTNAQFKRFTDSNPEWQPDRIPRELDNGNYLKHWKKPGELIRLADHPAVNVNWYAAVAYCRWAGKRLPTEAEWEHAARGGLNALFPWGNQPVDGSRATFSDSGLSATSPVGKYPANGYELFDMAGNVWQFLADEWKPYSSSPQKNPVAGGSLFLDGTAFLNVKTRRVIRGGSFGGVPVNLWVEYRDSHPPDGSRDFVGFRCAM